jgi:EmrB/QacA subfamily drug resistance transporter
VTDPATSVLTMKTDPSNTDPAYPEERRDARPTLRPLALPLICVAQLMATLDVTIVNLSLPSMQSALDLSNAGLAWVVDAYTLAYAGLLLVGGRAGDLLGHRRTLMIGVALFTLSSAVAGLADGAGVLLAARAGQGAGAALATPTTLALIMTLVPAGARRTRAMVAYGAMAGVGITLGLVLGGVLTEYASWRWVFLVNLPVGALILLAAPRLLPDTRGPRRRLDATGALVGTGTLLAATYGVIRAGTHGWGDSVSTAALFAAVGLAGLFVVVERHVAEPTLPLGLLAHRVRLGAYVVAGLLFASLYPSFFLLSRMLQQVLGHDPLAAGLRFLPIGVGVLLFAVAARRLVETLGPRPLVLAGTLAATAGSAGLLALDADSSYAVLLLPSLVGLGAGVGTTFVATSALSMTDVPEADTGIASGLLSTFQAVGGTIGVAVVASLAAGRTEGELAGSARPVSGDVLREALLSGFGLGFAVTMGLAAAALVVAFATSPRRDTKPGAA